MMASHPLHVPENKESRLAFELPNSSSTTIIVQRHPQLVVVMMLGKNK
jgi:hypothetical protein